MGNEQERMMASGFLKEEVINNGTACTSFFLHRSSRVLRGNGVKRITENILILFET